MYYFDMVGVDIVDLNRIKLKDSFVKYVLTEHEYEVYKTLKADRRRIEFLGGRFAAKEAIFKATQSPDYLNYSILNQKNGMPFVKDHPEIEISISHDGGIAISIAIVKETHE